MKRLVLIAYATPSSRGPGAGASAAHRTANPVVADKDVNSTAIPALPDGTIDIHGPWFGGRLERRSERAGGLKPGELPLLRGIAS